jgi:hypothetical protein
MFTFISLNSWEFEPSAQKAVSKEAAWFAKIRLHTALDMGL